MVAPAAERRSGAGEFAAAGVTGASINLIIRRARSKKVWVQDC
jgi:hypothetical protein